MKPVRTSVTIDRRQGQVCAYLDVLANQEGFADHFIRGWQPSGPTAGVSARLKATVKTKVGSTPIDLVIVKAHPPTTIVERTTSAGGKPVTRGTYRLESWAPDAFAGAVLALTRAPTYDVVGGQQLVG